MTMSCDTCAYHDNHYYRSGRCMYCRSVYDDTGTASEYVDVRNACVDYIGCACIDGTCPNAQEYEGYNLPIPCADCFYYKGCEDCAAPEMGVCNREVKQNGPEV